MSRRAFAKERAAARDALIIEHIGLARKIAGTVLHTLTRAGQNGYTSRLALGDMEGWAMVGLVQAADRYDAGRGKPFAHFAYRRIRGAILDAHKRSAYADMLHVAVETLSQASRDPYEGSHQRHEVERFTPACLHTDPAPGPERLCELSEREERLQTAIAALPRDERRVIRGALAGAPLAVIAAREGRCLTWGRMKLAAARRKVSAAVQGLDEAA